MRLLPWMSAASSGVPRLEGLARVARLVGASLPLVGIRLDVVPAGAPISNWNCSSGKLVSFILVKVLVLGLLCTSVPALQGLNLIVQLQHYVMNEFRTSIFSISHFQN